MHWTVKILKEFIAPFNILLEAGAILAFIAYGINTIDRSTLYLGIILVIIIIMTVSFNFYQSEKAESLIASFKDFIPAKTVVIREGVESSIEAWKLVVGDLVKIGLGERVPADVRIIETNSMKVDNSSLTG